MIATTLPVTPTFHGFHFGSYGSKADARCIGRDFRVRGMCVHQMCSISR